MRYTFLLSIIITAVVVSCNTENSDDPPDQAACDNGTITGMINLNTQQEVNEFGALCYTKIDGTLNIIDLNTESDKITDLTPLSNLEEIFTVTYPDSLYGTLRIQTSLLTNLQGLNNIKKVSRLIIEENESLQTLVGLESLESIDNENEYLKVNDLFILSNSVLTNLNGLDNLVQVGREGYNSRIWIGNPALENIDGFGNLIRIGTPISPEFPSDFGVMIYGNQNLQNLDGFSNLLEVYVPVTFFLFSDFGPPFTPSGNNSLTDFCGLQNLLTNGVYDVVKTNGGENYEGFSVSNQDIIDGNCSQ